MGEKFIIDNFEDMLADAILIDKLKNKMMNLETAEEAAKYNQLFTQMMSLINLKDKIEMVEASIMAGELGGMYMAFLGQPTDVIMIAAQTARSIYYTMAEHENITDLDSHIHDVNGLIGEVSTEDEMSSFDELLSGGAESDQMVADMNKAKGKGLGGI